MRLRSLPPDQSLSLTNDGTLQLFFIGVGSAFATRNYQLNFFIVQGDHHVLVDFGMTGPQALRDVARLKPTDVEVVLPTHSHADHVGGLECLALMNRYVGTRHLGKPKLKMIIDEHYQRILWDHTLRGGLEHNEQDPDSNLRLHFDDFFDVVRPEWKANAPRESLTVQQGPIHLELFRTNHIPEQSPSWENSLVSYGLFINNRVFVSCDTKFDRALIDQYAPVSEVMFHDVQFYPGAVHAFIDDLRTLPESVRQKMYLMHYADDWESQDASDFAGWTQQGIIYEFD